MEELSRLRDYYNQSFWAWFLPKNLSYALMYAGGYFDRHESQLQCAHLACNHFELAYEKMGAFKKWFFKRQFDDFKNSELYQKYLLIPPEERCTREETDFNLYDLAARAPLFPLLQSISGKDTEAAIDNAKKGLNLVLSLRRYGYSKQFAVYGIAHHTEDKDILYREFPLISLEQDYSSININLDSPISPSAEVFNTALIQLKKLIVSNDCPKTLNIRLPSTTKSDDLISLEQAIEQRPNKDNTKIIVNLAQKSAQIPLAHKANTIPFAYLQKIMPLIQAQPQESPLSFKEKLHQLIRQDSDHLSEIKTLVEAQRNQNINPSEFKIPLWRAAKLGKLDVVQYLTTLGGDLTLTQKGLLEGFEGALLNNEMTCADYFFEMVRNGSFQLDEDSLHDSISSLIQNDFKPNLWFMALHVSNQAQQLNLLNEETKEMLINRAHYQGVLDFVIKHSPILSNGDSDVIMPFKSIEYFQLERDREYGLFARFTIPALKLIAEYLNDKYNSKISFPLLYYPEASSTLSFFQMPSKNGNANIIDIEQSLRQLGAYLRPYRESTADYREAFFFVNDRLHVICMIYIKEGGNECLLNADSIGASISSKVEEKIWALTGIAFKYLWQARQVDGYSCYVDFLTFARDITAKEAGTDTYQLKDIFSYLDQNSLPDPLFKTAQSSEFLTHYRDKQRHGEVIHKELTLNQFREKYSEEISGKKISNYLRQKSLKYTRTVEIQYYLNEMKRVRSTSLSDDQKETFIHQAKASKNADLYQLTTDFIATLNEQSNRAYLS